MAIRVRLMAIAENMIQHQLPRVGYDLVGVQWNRRVKAFPEKATLWLVIDADMKGDASRGKQTVTVHVHPPGQTKPVKLDVPIDCGKASDARTFVQLPVKLDLTFTGPGKWRFSVWHKGLEWGKLEYLVADEATAAAAGVLLRKQNASIDDKMFASLERKRRWEEGKGK